jgi:hypothetical protein
LLFAALPAFAQSSFTFTNTNFSINVNGTGQNPTINVVGGQTYTLTFNAASVVPW